MADHGRLMEGDVIRALRDGPPDQAFHCAALVDCYLALRANGFRVVGLNASSGGLPFILVVREASRLDVLLCALEHCKGGCWQVTRADEDWRVAMVSKAFVR